MGRSVAWIFSGQVLALFFGVFTSVVVARSLGPEGQGAIAVALVLPAFLALIVGLGLNSANVYYAGNRRFPVSALASNSMFVVVLGTVAGGLVVFVLSITKVLGYVLPGVLGWQVALAFALLPLMLLRQSVNAIVVGVQRMRSAGVSDVVQSATIAALTFALVAVAGLGVGGALLAWAAGLAVALAYSWGSLHTGTRFPRPRTTGAVFKATVTFGIVTSFGILLQFVTYRLDLLLVNLWSGTAAAGYYSVATRLGELLWLLPGAIGTVVFAMTAADRGPNHDGTPRAFGAALAATTFGAIGLALFGQFAITLLYGTAFLGAFGPLLALLPGCVLLGSSSVLANDLAGRGMPRKSTLGAAGALVVTVILDLVLIPAYGPTGAGLASSFAYTTYFLIVLVMYLRAARLSLRSFVRAAISLRPQATTVPVQAK